MSWPDPTAPIVFTEHARRRLVEGRLSPGLVAEIVQLSEHVEEAQGPGTLVEEAGICLDDHALDMLDAEQARSLARVLLDLADVLDAAEPRQG